MAEILTFCQWLSHECCLTEEGLRILALEEYGEDAEDYIQGKHDGYNSYLLANK